MALDVDRELGVLREAEADDAEVAELGLLAAVVAGRAGLVDLDGALVARGLLVGMGNRGEPCPEHGEQPQGGGGSTDGWSERGSVHRGSAPRVGRWGLRGWRRHASSTGGARARPRSRRPARPSVSVVELARSSGATGGSAGPLPRCVVAHTH